MNRTTESRVINGRTVEGQPAPLWLAYRHSYMYGGALEGSSETREELLDADTDPVRLTRRVNAHFALPETIRAERGRKHIIPDLALKSPSLAAYGGGAHSDVWLEIRQAPTLKF